MAKEEKIFESVNLYKLTNPELSQFVDRQTSDIEAQGTEVLTDATMNELLAVLKTIALDFHQAILQIQKSPYSDLLFSLDKVRDRAVRNYDHALKQFKYSEIPEELKAYHKLLILSSTYKGFEVLNYEAQTKEMKKFLEAIDSDQFRTEVTLLDLGGYVNKIKISEAKFNQHFDSRINEVNTKAAYKALVLRRILQKDYNHFTGYILALVNGLDKEPYNNSLKLMNTTRKAYDTLVKRREGLKGSDVTQPETETPT